MTSAKSRLLASIIALMAWCAGASAQSFKVEVVFDTDNGIGRGDTIIDAAEGVNMFDISTDGLEQGAHLVTFRTQDGDGRWSTSVTRPFLLFEPSGFDAAEYFIDTDPGAGKAHALPMSASGSISFTVPTADLAVGLHTLTVRLSSGGAWNASMSKVFKVLPDAMIYEWFFDKDPGTGLGNQMEATTGENIFFLPTESLSAGAHLFSSRVRNAAGVWSITVSHPVYVTEPMEEIVTAEFFVDDDPGEGNGTAVTLADNGEAAFTFPTDKLSVGKHSVTLRGADASGRWIPLFSSPFEVLSASGVNTVEWRKHADIARTADKLTVTAAGDLPAGCTVSVTSLGGITLHRIEWTDTATPLVIPLTNPARVIVAVTAPDGTRTVSIK